MKTTPLISIAIPTYNSERTLEATLESITNQKYPKSRIEILIADGGSTDKTISIAARFGCKIIKNDKVDLIYGKHLAFLRAKGKYLINIDSDESFQNPNTIKNRVESFLNNKNIKAILLSGYLSPKNPHPINDYLNEFGDPFSFFVYRQSKGFKYLLQDLKKSYPIIEETNLYIIFNFKKNLPLIELWAGGCMIDLEYVKKTFKDIKTKPYLIAHLFYLIDKQDKFLAVMKDEPTIHNSSSSLNQYQKKLISRVKNNIFITEMGEGGYSGRENLTKGYRNLKKYLFVPYSFSIILPSIDGLCLSISRRKLIYLLHPYLCIYTSVVIIYFYILKLTHIPVTLRNYGR